MLVLLTEEPMHGYQIMQELEERSEGGWQPSPGSIYPTLQLLADEGLVVSTAEGGKNIFSLTDSGRAAAAETAGPPAWERFATDETSGFVSLRRAVAQLVAAAKQVAAAGSDEHVRAAQTIVDDARRSLYRLLAEDDD